MNQMNEAKIKAANEIYNEQQRRLDLEAQLVEFKSLLSDFDQQQDSLKDENTELRAKFQRVLLDFKVTSSSTIRQLRNELSALQKEHTSLKDYLRKTIEAVQHKLVQ